MSSSHDQPGWRDRMCEKQVESDTAWASFVRSPRGGCFTIILIVIAVASLVYGFFIA